MRFTERAKAWLKEEQPNSDQIQDAYSKMRAKIQKEPDIDSADAEHCLDLLVEAYGANGNQVDDLLVQDVQQANDDYTFDPSPLGGPESQPAKTMSHEDKRKAFLELKRIIADKSVS
tara:strand:+ start:8582 stop:8932 length:351 start_codon:yes stop_codon:yes gene_type:complete